MKPAAPYKQPWLHRPLFDVVYIILPAFLALVIAILLPARFKQTSEMPLISWVVLILLIDVAHVYSTIFRTYWDKERFSKHKALYTIIPILCYITGVLLYALDGLLFWRILAYLAVFHFIRQQYGFMRLYSRYEPKNSWLSKIDIVAIYTATLYPILYWHCTPGRNFNWFIDGDFVLLSAAWLKEVGLAVYLSIITIYVCKELVLFIRSRHINLPKNLIVAGTFLSWYVGIVYFNGDMVFTLLNVVAHGIPYMALIWIFRKKEQQAKAPLSPRTNTRYYILFFLLSIFLFAFIEEGLWDGLIWRERPQVFSLFSFLPVVNNKELLALLIPLLSLPQSTHYVLDGFIWKKEKSTMH